MEKQVEVRMHENHLEPSMEKPEPACFGICAALKKNLLLTVTILGMYLSVVCFECPVSVSVPVLFLFCFCSVSVFESSSRCPSYLIHTT